MIGGAEIMADGAGRGKRVMLVVGEASGDLHGADLIRALKERAPALEAFGVAGENLSQTDFEALLSASQLAGMGLVELAGNLGNLWRAYGALRAALRARRPDLLILIDFPEFNLRLAKAAKRLGVPVLYYISPQIWAWRPGRIRAIARRVDHMAVVFPFEADLYAKRGVAVTFVGHPLLDRVRATMAPADTLKRLGLEPGRKTVALLPGSRRREVAYHLPVMLEAARRLSGERDAQFILVRASTVAAEQTAPLLERASLRLAVADRDRYDALAACDLAWTASGTATLETALMMKPMVIMYRLSRLTYWIARLLVDVRHIGMVNIIAGERVVPELIQSEVTAEGIVRESRPLLDDGEMRRGVVRKLSQVRQKLGSPGASGRVADLALKLMS